MSVANNNLTYVDVAAGILVRHGLFLATQRPEGKPMAGYWELPGGKLESHETPEAALCRELAEELGIKVVNYQKLRNIEHVYRERGYPARLHFFLVTSFKGEPCPKESQNLRWISRAEISELDFLPPDAAMLRELAAKKLFSDSF